MGMFNGKDDFLPVLTRYLNDIFVTPVQASNDDEEVNTRLDLTLKEPPTLIEADRVIYGYFDAGVSGQDILVRNRHDKTEVFRGDRDNHGLFRNLFFYIQLPYRSKAGYLIMQKRSRFGVKSVFTHTLKKWLSQNGYEDTLLDIKAILNGQVFNKMLDNGNLKKVNFIVDFIPNNIEEFYANDEHPNRAQGTMTTTIQSKGGLTDFWTQFARTQYQREDRKTIVEINGEEKEYAEIEFEIEVNGRRKTFYANRKDRTVPDLDVTGEIQRDIRTGEPLLGSLIEKCREIVNDTFDIRPNV